MVVLTNLIFSLKLGKSFMDNHRGKKNLVMSSWGDESLLYEGYVNPYYFPEHYQSYSERTQQSLVSLNIPDCGSLVAITSCIIIPNQFHLILQKSLNEDVIDFDLLEELICHIDVTCPPGAILVFLPVCYINLPLLYPFSLYISSLLCFLSRFIIFGLILMIFLLSLLTLTRI